MQDLKKQRYRAISIVPKLLYIHILSILSLSTFWGFFPLCGDQLFPKDYEKALYAITSLRSYLEEKSSYSNPSKTTIYFDKDDIAHLWNVVFTQAPESEMYYLQRAYQKFYSATHISEQKDAELQNDLEMIWLRLNRQRPKCCLFKKYESIYPNFDDNPSINAEMRKKIRPYLLPLENHLKPCLDTIFSQLRVVHDEQSLAAAGFSTLCFRSLSQIHVIKHPVLDGYLLKVYLDTVNRGQQDQPGWKWLVQRCQGAENVRNVIRKKRLKYFVVPDKWLYPLPHYPTPHISVDLAPQPVVLVVTDMQLASKEETINAWKHKITTQHLDELYCILSYGYATASLVENIPYTIHGTFACIDTEYPQRRLKLGNVKQFLCSKMAIYWDKIVKNGGPKNKK